MSEGFWGLSSPTGTGRPRAHVLGPSAPFFRRILEASRYVELYDERLRYEPWRRGVATSFVAPGALEERIRNLRSAFFALVGYGRTPSPYREGVLQILFSPAADVPRPRGPAGPDVVVGAVRQGAVRSRRPPLVVSARQLERGAGIDLEAGGAQGAVVVFDPHVMDRSLTGLGKEAAGRLTWYPLCRALEECFAAVPVRAVRLLPRPLSRRDAYPHFVLARLLSRIIALALVKAKGS